MWQRTRRIRRGWIGMIIVLMLWQNGWAQESNREQIDALLQQAMESYDAGEYEKAIEQSTQAITLDSAYAIAYWLRGNVYGLQEQYESAIVDMRKVIELNSHFADAYGSLGWYLIVLGKFEEAKEPCQKAYELAPENAAWAVNVGHVYLLNGDVITARTYYKKALPLFPSEAEFQQGPKVDIELFIQNGWEVEACQKELIWMEQAWQSLKRVKEDAEQLDQQVNDLEQQGRYTEAIPLAEKVLTIREDILGPEHPDTILSLNNLAELYYSMGDYVRAESLYRRVMSIQEKVSGLEHPSMAINLTNLATLYYKMGNYANAELFYQQALSILENVLGPEHPKITDILNNLALLHKKLGNYANAESLLQRALAIRENVSGPEHLETATSLNNLAALYDDMGDYANAEPIYQRALSILEKVLGADHPSTAISLNNLATLYHKMGNYARVEPLYQRTLSILEKVLGSEHPDTVTCLNNLAELYHAMGDNYRAEPVLQRVLAIREKMSGSEHSDTATSLNNLATLYDDMGDYANAEPLYQRALAIQEKVLGSEHPNTAQSLNNLAGLYYAMGNYAQAESHYQRALVIREKVLSSEHPDTATSLNNLAVLYQTMGDYTNAESFLQRALTIQEKVLGSEHPDTAQSIGNLASLYGDIGNYAQAESLSHRVLAIREKMLGVEHPDTAVGLNNLAALYHEMGNYTNAVPLYKRALAIHEKALGPDHPRMATSLNNLAILSVMQNNFLQAHGLFLQAQQIDEQMIEQVQGFTSQAQQQTFLATTRNHLEGFLSLISQHLLQHPDAPKDGLDIWLRRKGILLETQQRFQEALLQSDDPEALAVFEDLSQVRAQIMRLTFAGPGNENPLSYRQRLSDLKHQADALEAKLSRLSQPYAAQQERARADTAQAAAALPPHAALVEFAKIRMFDFNATGREEKWQPARYLAFVLHAGQPDQVALIDLGAAEVIDAAITTLRANIVAQRSVREAAQALHVLVFAPLLPELGKASELFLSPDGNLNLIPFEVLIGADERFLIEDYTFTYLAAGRDLIGRTGQDASERPPLIIGDPDFDLALHPDLAAEDDSAPSRLLTGRFTRLPHTRAEVGEIQIWLGADPSTLFTDKDAVEEVLMNAHAPGILHIATHGFFLEDQELAIDDGGPRLEFQGMTRSAGPVLTIAGVPFENPLLRSGLVFAGVNPALNAGRSDGVVTADKILGLKLQGTDVVVLSACDTGLGDVKVGEGVYGLRRAFLQAGAKSLVMSLWSVPDEKTRELMSLFYQFATSGMPRNQALREAALRQMRVLKQNHDFPQPFYWGAFVFLGQP